MDGEGGAESYNQYIGLRQLILIFAGRRQSARGEEFGRRARPLRWQLLRLGLLPAGSELDGAGGGKCRAWATDGAIRARNGRGGAKLRRVVRCV